MPTAELLKIEPGAGHGARHQILHEDIGASEEASQNLVVGRVFDIENDGFLAAVEPYEIAALTAGGPVVAARKIAFRLSILITRAPALAKRHEQSGAATACSTETTSIPSSGRTILPSGIRSRNVTR
jgi:hypothetical protein